MILKFPDLSNFQTLKYNEFSVPGGKLCGEAERWRCWSPQGSCLVLKQIMLCRKWTRSFSCVSMGWSALEPCESKKKQIKQNALHQGYGVLLCHPNIFWQLPSLTARRRDCWPRLLGETSSSSLWTVPRRWGKASWEGKENQKTGNILRLLKNTSFNLAWRYTDLMVGLKLVQGRYVVFFGGQGTWFVHHLSSFCCINGYFRVYLLTKIVKSVT